MITVECNVKSLISKVWEYFTGPEHIMNWYHASDDWHVPYAENELKINGKFKTTMAAKDGSFSFDFEGIYTNILDQSIIEYTLADGRKVKITFTFRNNETIVTESFDPEQENSMELQQNGWQAILNNFKTYVEQK
jgi:uncharacterized protein YndB with AHSA1/START domain